MEQNKEICNKIYCGDSNDILKNIPSDSIDLCYIDPPFFTSRKYEVIWGDGAEKRAFEDRWVKMGENGRFSKDINVYLNFIEPIIKEIYRVLKTNGTFYLHCDYHADAYLRILCDTIFGYDNLINHIIWVRTKKVKGTAKKLGNVTDSIFLYAKNKDLINMKIPRMELTEKQKDRDYPNFEKETGRRFNTGGLIKDGDSPKQLKLPNSTILNAPQGKRFVWTQDTLDAKLKENPNILHFTKSEIPRYKIYLDEHEGIPISNIWDDIEEISTLSKERLGYPTQKPERLLERIITMTSNNNDIILDAFCGCGTSIAVAKRLKRRFIGIDISPTAIRLIAKRLNYPLSEIIGLPYTSEEISQLTGFEFQNAVIRALDPSLKRIKIGNKGADGGIDGSYFNILISVKKYKAGRKDLDEFIATLYRNKKSQGIFIALDYSSDFSKEVARLLREQKIVIHMLNLKEIIDDKKHESILMEENKKQGLLM